MLGVGDRLPDFSVTGVKPKFNNPDESGQSAFAEITPGNFPGNWKLVYFYPKDLAPECPAELIEFGRLAAEFLARNAVVLAGSSDNEFCKLAWRKTHPDLASFPAWQFADTNGSLIDGLGVRAIEGVALRALFIVDPDNIIQHASVNNLGVGPDAKDALRILNALQTEEKSSSAA
ncbi:MAG: redoxin domain-containing protein [Parvularculaceae bacterium]